MSKRRLTLWAVLGITLLAAVLRLYQLGAQSFWWDECFTYIITATLPPANAWQAMIEDANKPPLYYLLMQRWVRLAGTSEYAYRFPSAALGLLSVPIMYHLGRRLGGRAVGLAAALLLAVCPFHVWYSQDARMYAPMTCFSLVAMDRFVLSVRGRPRWIAFTVSSGLAYLMHYAGASLIYVQLGWFLPRLRQTGLLRRWFLAQAFALAPLVPWLIVVYGVRNLRPTGLGWIPYPGLLAPLASLWNWVTADVETVTLPVMALMAGVAVVFLRGLFPWNEERRLLAWWLALPIGFLFLLSLRRPYYVDRYLMASLPAFLLILSFGITAWRRAALQLVAAAVVLTAMIWGVTRLYADPLFFKEDWRGVATAVEEGLGSGDVVLMQDQETFIGTSAYATRQWPYVVLSEEGAVTIEAAAAGYKRIWLVWRSPYEYNHRLSKSDRFDILAEATPPVRAWLAAHQSQLALDLRLPGLSLVRIDTGDEP